MSLEEEEEEGIGRIKWERLTACLPRLRILGCQFSHQCNLHFFLPYQNELRQSCGMDSNMLNL